MYVIALPFMFVVVTYGATPAAVLFSVKLMVAPLNGTPKTATVAVIRSLLSGPSPICVAFLATTIIVAAVALFGCAKALKLPV